MTRLIPGCRLNWSSSDYLRRLPWTLWHGNCLYSLRNSDFSCSLWLGKSVYQTLFNSQMHYYFIGPLAHRHFQSPTIFQSGQILSSRAQFHKELRSVLSCVSVLIASHWWYWQLILRRILLLCEIEPRSPNGILVFWQSEGVLASLCVQNQWRRWGKKL